MKKSTRDEIAKAATKAAKQAVFDFMPKGQGEPGNAPRSPGIPSAALRSAVARLAGKQRRESLKLNPFTMVRPPPGVLPEGTEPVLAMDDAFGAGFNAWAGAANQMAGPFIEGTAFLGYAYLATLAQRAEYRVISETIAEDCTRKFIKIESTGKDGEKDDSAASATGDKIKAIAALFDQWRVRDAMFQIIEQDGLFGRAHLYVDTGDTNDLNELKTPIGEGGDFSKAKIRKGKKEIVALRTVEAVWCYPSNYNSNNPLKSDWYNPTSWFCMGTEIHVSRLLKFVGREVPDLLKPAYAFGGLSMSQMARPYIDNWLNTRQAVADIIQNFSLRTLKTDLQALLQEGGEDVDKRVTLFNLLANNQGVALLNNGTEDMGVITTPLSGLSDLQGQSQEHMAAISRIPLVKLLGIQPAGLNASSEGEIVTYEEHIHAYQEKMMRVPLTTLLKFAQLQLFGEVDPAITFSFLPLREMSEKDRADIEKTKAETDDLLVNGVNAVSPEEVRARVAKDPNSGYDGIDPDEMPEPPEDPEVDLHGTEPFGGGEPDEQESDMARDKAPAKRKRGTKGRLLAMN